MESHASIGRADGPSLEERLRAGSLPAREVVAVARALAQALAGLHDAGVVHGDVAARNVVFAADGVKLVGLRGGSDRRGDVRALGALLDDCLARLPERPLGLAGI